MSPSPSGARTPRAGVRRVLWVLVAFVVVALAAGCGSSGSAPAPAAKAVAAIRGSGLFTTDTTMTSFTPVVAQGVEGAAYDSAGQLWYSSTAEGSDGSRCDLYRAGDSTPAWRFAQIAGALGEDSGLCALWRDPKGGLLFAADNGTAGSATIWHIDTTSGALSRISDGTAVAASPDGAMFVIARHLYTAKPGAEDSLWTLTRGSTEAARLTPPRQPLLSPAFSPDGAQLAAIDNAGRLVVRPERGVRKVALTPQDGQVIESYDWASDSALIAIVGADNSAAPSALLVPLDGTEAQPLVDNVSQVATAP